MLESLMAFLVLVTFFGAALQFAYLSMASMLIQHAAIVGARSAAVVIPDMPGAYDDGTDFNLRPDAGQSRYQEIFDAASSVLKAIQPLPFNAAISTRLTDLVVTAADGNCMECEPMVDKYEPTNKDDSSQPPRWPLIRVTVTYDMECTVPFGGWLVCGPDGKRSFTAAASMQLQGAIYGYF